MTLNSDQYPYGKKRYFSPHGKTKTLKFLIALVTLGNAVQADPLATRSTPTAPTSPTQAAQIRHIDRMAILTQERDEILSKLKKWEANGDKAVLARIQADLQSIEREIAVVSRQPVYPTHGVAMAQRAVAKPVSAAPAANQESQTEESEKFTYEGWDIFKNFGRKGN